MPSLNEYSEDNNKEGFYIRANVGGSHPITLQVTIVASHIFRALNYQAGDAVPTELVWSMYDLNMLYTLTSVDIGDTPTDTSAAKVLQQLELDNKLSDEERAELISYLEAYEGPDAERIQQLREELVENLSEEGLEQVTTGEGSWFPISNQLPESLDEVANLLYEWSGSNMLRKAHKALILNENFVTWSVRTFAAHQYLHQKPLESITDNEITYRLNPPKRNKELTISDSRGHNREVTTHRGPDSVYDYRLRRVLSDGTIEYAYLRGDIIIKYDSFEGDSGSSAILKYDIEDILPPQYSYFGGTDDEPYAANLLTEHHLGKSISTIKREQKRSDTNQTDSNCDNSGGKADESKHNKILQVVNKIQNTELLTIQGESNNGNLKTELNGHMVVITSNIDGSKGDKVVVKLPTDNIEHSITVDAAERLHNIPEQNARDWIQTHL